MKPRLRWNGQIWVTAGRRKDAWRYWRAWYATSADWGIETRFYADRCAELLPI